MIQSELDLLELDIVDFNRVNNHFNNPREALEVATSWVKGLAIVTLVEVDDFWTVPKRDDFPGWDHVGYHPTVGRQYWNWFYHHHPKGELYLSDSPDICGILEDGALLFGDFGKVSAPTFIMALKRMTKGDIWVSISLDGSRQVIIEYLVKMRGFSSQPEPRRRPQEMALELCQQLALFK